MQLQNNDNDENNTIAVQLRPFFVYLLQSTDKTSTYIGATVDLNHRLRQHNGEISGGAKATSKKVKKGQQWTRVGYVTGFVDWKSALQFEWRWKQLSRTFSKKQTQLKIRSTAIPIMDRRLGALRSLLQLDRPTSKAQKYSDWPAPPTIVFEDEEWKLRYESGE